VIPEDQHDGARATIREVMALVEQARRDALAEIRQLRTEFEAKIALAGVEHEADRKAHEEEHKREENRKAGRLRWAVSTIMTGGAALLGFAIAIWRK
jgi:regulator of protease activity HflC (stomatin/prohibitin superfamily)